MSAQMKLHLVPPPAPAAEPERERPFTCVDPETGEKLWVIPRELLMMLIELRERRR